MDKQIKEINEIYNTKPHNRDHSVLATINNVVKHIFWRYIFRGNHMNSLQNLVISAWHEVSDNVTMKITDYYVNVLPIMPE